MKPASTEFYTQLEAGSLTLCRIWRITPRGLPTIFLTEHDRDITFDGDVYESSNSVECSAISNQIGGASMQFEFTALLGTWCTRVEVERGVFDGTLVEIDYVMYDHLDYGAMPLASGRILGMNLQQKDVVVFEVAGRTATKAKHPIGEQYSPTCRAEFCDERCTLNIEDYSEDITVASVTDNLSFTASEVAVHGANHYNLGTVTFLTGDNAGKSLEVKRSTDTGLVELMLPTPFAIQIGDTATIRRGCDKTWAMCKTYDNFLNFRGEPFVPGADFQKAPKPAKPVGEAGTPPPALPGDWVPVDYE